MVAGGAGVGIVPRAAVLRWHGRVALHWVALRDRWANRRLQLCARNFAALPGFTRELVAHLHGT